MCGRYTVLTEDEIMELREILENIPLPIVRDDFKDYDKKPGDVFPSDSAPIITSNPDGIAFESVKWGFKKWNGTGLIINARCETIKQKSIFSRCIETGRCVVPAGEFFQWKKLGKTNKKYYAKDKNGDLLFMAGLYRDHEGERESVIITKEAAGEMAEIHDRVPVILRAGQLRSWLNGEMAAEDIEKMEYDVSVAPCEEENDVPEQISLF